MQVGKWPTEDSFTSKCELPVEDPEEAYCGPEYFRNSSRTEYNMRFFEAHLNQAKSQNYMAQLNYKKGKRCAAARFAIAHPFTCIITPEKLGSYACLLVLSNIIFSSYDYL